MRECGVDVSTYCCMIYVLPNIMFIFITSCSEKFPAVIGARTRNGSACFLLYFVYLGMAIGPP
jgi:hypothetical protein